MATEKEPLAASLKEVPPGFPGGPGLASLAGTQPKLAVRRSGDHYVAEATTEEIAERHEICEDLVQQLLSYCLRKQTEHPAWSLQTLLQKVAIGVRKKGWPLSDEEVAWVLHRLEIQLAERKK